MVGHAHAITIPSPARGATLASKRRDLTIGDHHVDLTQVLRIGDRAASDGVVPAVRDADDNS